MKTENIKQKLIQNISKYYNNTEISLSWVKQIVRKAFIFKNMLGECPGKFDVVQMAWNTTWVCCCHSARTETFGGSWLVCPVMELTFLIILLALLPEDHHVQQHSWGVWLHRQWDRIQIRVWSVFQWQILKTAYLIWTSHAHLIKSTALAFLFVFEKWSSL